MLTSAVRPLLVRAWMILIYSVPTSFLLLFAAGYGLGDGAPGAATATDGAAAVALGNRELMVFVAMLGMLVVLSIGSAADYWLDSRRPEVFVRFLAGAGPTAIAVRLLGALAAVNGVGFAMALAAYAATDVALPAPGLPALKAASVTAALAVSSVLVVGTTAASVIPATRGLHRARMY